MAQPCPLHVWFHRVTTKITGHHGGCPGDFGSADVGILVEADSEFLEIVLKSNECTQKSLKQHLNSAFIIEQTKGKWRTWVGQRGTRGLLGHFLSNLSAGADVREHSITVQHIRVDTHSGIACLGISSTLTYV